MTTDNFCFYLQNRLIETSQTGGQWYNDTSPFSIPWYLSRNIFVLCFHICMVKSAGANIIKLFTAVSYDFS